MKVVSVTENFEDYFDLLYQFCNQAVWELERERIVSETTIKNMSTENWKKNNCCLLYRVFVKNDFKNGNGMLNILYDGYKPIFINGVMKYNDEISVAGKRTYCLKKYRGHGLFHDYVLDEQLKWSKENGFKACLILFNGVAVNLYRTLKREKEGKVGHFGDPHYRFFDFMYLDGEYKIFNTMQHVAVYKIDEKFDVDKIQWEI